VKAKPAAVAAVLAADEAEDSALSRGQRKRQSKKNQYLKKEQLILSSLKLQKDDEEKKRLFGLNALRDALLSSVQAQKQTQKQQTDNDADTKEESVLKTNKSRQKLVGKEVTQMSLVLQHPEFQADPFAAMREHLENTIAKDKELHKKEAYQHVKERADKITKKKAVKKEHGVKKKRNKFNATRSKSR
jgi:ABC-type dipeptide/oligopeptide/nickel transport system ATPase component